MSLRNAFEDLATEGTVASLLTDAQLRANPVLMVNQPPPFMRVGFAEVGAGLQGLAAAEFTLLQTGPGMAVNQSSGNLVITSGTTANSETVIRSVGVFSGALLARYKATLSQRIANNLFRFELADLIGDDLAFTVDSATSVTVVVPGTTLTAANVGQSMRLSRISGAAGIPGRFAIASVAGTSITFTVVDWPATGSGTLSLYGWNHLMVDYGGTSATQCGFDAQRRGRASGTTTATINNTAGPGHVAQIGYDVFTAGLSDSLVASNAGYQFTNRASRIENLPDPEVDLFLFIVVQNGTAAPASATTLTVGFIQVEDQGRQKIRIAGSDPVGSHAQPVQIMGPNPLQVGFTQPALVASTARVGFVGGAGMWYDDSSTVLAANATFTGTTRDATVAGTAAAFANAATHAKEVRVLAESDQTGTLWLEASRDGTTWRRIRSVATAAVTGGGQAAEIIYRPSWRYWRVGFLNGATLQTRFTIGSMALAV